MTRDVNSESANDTFKISTEGSIKNCCNDGNVFSSFSLNRINNSVSLLGMTERTVGAVRSGLFANTEFCLPGVPPLSSSAAVQFSDSVQIFCRSISSNDQPPLCLSLSRYHR